jgi:flagellin-like hook-associated protein FlgL
MSISAVAANISPVIQSVLEMRRKLDDLQRQLGTGMKADTYAGLGPHIGLAVGLTRQLDAITSFNDTITVVGTRIGIAQTALTQIADAGNQVKSGTLLPNFVIDGTGQTNAQKSAYYQLDQILSLLNTQVGDRFLFSGTAVDQPSVETIDHILNGNGAQAGLKQLISERNQADVGGPTGLGRLVIPPAAGTNVSISEDVAGSVFGLKLAGVNSTLTGAVVTGPAGAPPLINVNLAANPASGDRITFTFNLPDGTTEDLTLEATTSTTPGPNQFTIGATANQTAINLQAALTTSVDKLAHSSLSAASAIAAAGNFFANPPQRVATSPFTTATALAPGTPANTVSWYIGENGPTSPRSTATARIDPAIVVSYGLRANEQGIAWIVQQVATIAATTYLPTDPNAPASYTALNQRLNTTLAVPQGIQKIDDISSSLASAQAAMQTAKDRHRQAEKQLTDMLQSIEMVDPNLVGAQILTVQTNLQASLETTAMLSKLSLVNVL